MKKVNVRAVAFTLLALVGGLAALPLIACENKNAAPAASPADASGAATVSSAAPSAAAPAPKATGGGGGW